MEIILNKTIKVKKFKALIDIGIKEKRTDIVALLMIAKSHNDTLSNQIIYDEFIFRENKAMANRILQRCQELGVVNENLRITEEGINAREEGMIYRPYTGTYYVWATEDTLLPQKILNIEIIDENINFKNEILGQRNSEEDTFEKNIETLPEWLKDAEQLKNIKLLDENKRQIRIESIQEKIEPISVSEKLHAQVNLSNNSKLIQFTGLFEDERELSIFPNIHSVWEQLLESSRYEKWDWEDETLQISFKELKEKEILTFIKKFEFNSPTIENFGLFNTFSLNLKIKPQSDTDAELWGNWLLEHQIKEYMFPSVFEKYRETIYKKFQDYNIKLEELYELSTKTIEKVVEDEVPIDFWFVQAPLDLYPLKNKGDD